MRTSLYRESVRWRVLTCWPPASYGLVGRIGDGGVVEPVTVATQSASRERDLEDLRLLHLAAAAMEADLETALSAKLIGGDPRFGPDAILRPTEEAGESRTCALRHRSR